MSYPNERITELCNRLQLPFIAEHCSLLIDQASKSEMSFSEFAEQLLAIEAQGRDERSAKTLMKFAGFPAIKTLGEYDFDFSLGVNKQQIMELSGLSFVQEAKNIILLGSSGVGKTHLSIALGVIASQSRIKTKFIAASDLLIQMQEAKKAKRYNEYLKRIVMMPRLLIIDEIGYFPMNREDANHFFQVISRRYERGSTILTSNLPFSKWTQIFNDDAIITTAILDRLLHHSVVVNIQGDSFRLKDKKKEGFISLPTPPKIKPKPKEDA